MSEAREYVGPVRPRRSLRWDAACGVEELDGGSAEWRAGFNHAMQTVALWLDFQVSALPPEPSSRLPLGPGISSIGMLKSNLLGRLMRGEEIRRRPCPVHAGRLQMGGAALGQDLGCCDGTGWLPNPTEPLRADDDADGQVHWWTHAHKESWWRDLPADQAE